MATNKIVALVRRIHRDDRGSVSAEVVLLLPVILMLLLGIVQFTLWSHATHIAQAAAAQALATARAGDGSPAAGSANAQQLLDELAAGPLFDSKVDVHRDAASASVRISGTATSVVPFLHLPVHAEAAGPVERFVPNVNGFTNSEGFPSANRSGGTR